MPPVCVTLQASGYVRVFVFCRYPFWGGVSGKPKSNLFAQGMTPGKLSLRRLMRRIFQCCTSMSSIPSGTRGRPGVARRKGRGGGTWSLYEPSKVLTCPRTDLWTFIWVPFLVKESKAGPFLLYSFFWVFWESENGFMTLEALGPLETTRRLFKGPDFQGLVSPWKGEGDREGGRSGERVG